MRTNTAQQFEPPSRGHRRGWGEGGGSTEGDSELPLLLQSPSMFDEQSRFAFGNPATGEACCCLQAGCVNFNLVQVTPEKIGIRSRKNKKRKTRKGGSAVIRPDCRPNECFIC